MLYIILLLIVHYQMDIQINHKFYILDIKTMLWLPDVKKKKIIKK